VRLMARIRIALILAVLVLAAVTVLPKLGFDFRHWGYGLTKEQYSQTDILIYEGTPIQMPYEAPDARAYREAQRRPDKVVLLIRWKGPRIFEVGWQNETKTYRPARLVHPHPDPFDTTTWSVVLDVDPGDRVGIGGFPLFWEDRDKHSRPIGWAESMIFHLGEIHDRKESADGVVASKYLVPA
jgi:hypothetical protein